MSQSRSRIRVTSKRSLTKTKGSPFIDAMRCAVGQRPEVDSMRNARRLLRKWQEKAFWALQKAYFAILIAPTGAGKSALQKALAWLRILNGEKLILAVPEQMIGSNFSAEQSEVDATTIEYLLPDDKVMRWEVAPENFLVSNDPAHRITDEGIVARVKAFVRAPASTIPNMRILICTHAAIVRAFVELIREWAAEGRDGSPFAGTNLYVDEAHHCRILGEDEFSEEDEDRCNRLGDIVRHYVENSDGPGKCGRMLLTTATWLRGDGETIVPKECLSLFEQHEYPIDEYLAAMNHLKNIGFRLSVAETYEEALAAEMQGDNRTKRTIVALPRVKKGDGDQKKYENMRLLLPALGPATKLYETVDDALVKSGDPEAPVKKHGSLVSVDLVNPVGRSKVRSWFDCTKNGTSAAHVVFVQNLFREGANWPAAERYIVMGARGSLPMIIQMIGRLLRDYCPVCGGEKIDCPHGKRYVEFHIVLLRSEIEASEDDFDRFITTIFKVMALGWQFTVDLQLPARARTQRVIKEIIAECRNRVANEGDLPPGEAMRETLAKALDKTGTTLPLETVVPAARSLLSCLNQTTKIVMNSLKDLKGRDVERLTAAVEKDAFAGLREFCHRANATHFAAWREQYGTLPEVTPEYLKRRIFLSRCVGFENDGLHLDWRTLPGAVALFGSAEALDKACTAEGLVRWSP